jgi:prolyl 4-hydroxylase
MEHNKIVLHNDPYIYIIDDFISHHICDHFIEISKNKMNPALVSGNNSGFISKGRTGLNCWIKHNYDNITNEIANKISSLVSYPLQNAESFQIIYYDINQEYKIHYDAWNNDKKRCLQHGGQRMLTTLVYLNDVEEGGNTYFPKLKLSIQPKKGRILVFENCIKNTNNVHPLTQHTGTPVLQGEKYAFNLWFREKNTNANV